MISKKDFINSIHRIVIPKMTALQHTQKTPISNYIGMGIVFLILLSLFLLQLLFFFGAILSFVKNKSFTGGFAIILTALLAYGFIWVLIRLVKVMSNNNYLSDKSIRVLNEEVLKALYFRKIKFNKPDAKAFFNEIQFFDPPVKHKVNFDDDLSFSFDNGGINVYTGYFQSSNNGRNDMDMFLFEIPLRNFYKTPVVFTLGDKESDSAIDFASIDNATEAFTVSGNTQDIQYLKDKGVCEKLLNIGNPEFNDDCIWCIHASFYHDKLHIAFDIEYSLSADLEDGYAKIKAYETFYDNVAAIEQYCQQFKDL